MSHRPTAGALVHVMGAPRGHQDLVRLTRAQNGAVSIHQLRAAGLTREAIRARVERGRLVRLFPGAYAAGDPELMPLARPAAALLSLGARSFLSHRAAAAVWELIDGFPDVIDVTLSAAHRRPRPGVRIHRVKRLDPRDVARRSGLRLTSPARTLIDFAGQATSSELNDAFGHARARRLLTNTALQGALARLPQNHAGAAVVRALLREGGTYDRSKAERILRRLCGRAELPQPLVNVDVRGFTADFFWPEARLILEVDGYRTHGTRLAFERDRRRDQVHIAAGYVVLRVTWHQLQHEPLAVLARLAQALGRRAA